MKCEEIRELFPEALYGELDDRRTAEFNAHLVTCTSCTREYEGLKQTLALMSRRTRVEPTGAEWNEFSRKLDEKLAAEPGFGAAHLRPTNGIAHPGTVESAPAGRRTVDAGPAGSSRPVAGRKRPAVIAWLPAIRPAWAYGIAAVLLVSFGIYMGRTFFNGTPAPAPSSTADEMSAPGTASPESTPAQSAPQAASPSADRYIAQGESGQGEAGQKAAGRPLTRPGSRSAPGATAQSALDATNREALSYLERSRNLLIGLTNLDEEQSASLDLTRPRQVSRDLYDRGNTLAVALNQPSQQQLRQLVQNLQIILLQLSNMGVRDGKPAVEIIRQGVDSQSILLKINLEAIRASLEEVRAGGPGEKSKHNL